MGLTSIKISSEHYQQIKAIAEKTDMGIRAVAERLIAEGLNATEHAGKVVISNPEALSKVEKSLADMRESQTEILDRLGGIEDEVVGDEPDESSQGKKFEVAVPSVSREEVDGFKYHCTQCGSLLTGESEENRPETCRDCGAKLDWARLESSKKASEGSGAGGVLLAGFLTLLALSALRSRVGNNQV